VAGHENYRLVVASPVIYPLKKTSVATGLFKFSPDFVSKKTQKNPGIENYIQSSKIRATSTSLQLASTRPAAG